MIYFKQQIKAFNPIQHNFTDNYSDEIFESIDRSYFLVSDKRISFQPGISPQNSSNYQIEKSGLAEIKTASSTIVNGIGAFQAVDGNLII
jgi:hypothetical protein